MPDGLGVTLTVQLTHGLFYCESPSAAIRRETPFAFGVYVPYETCFLDMLRQVSTVDFPTGKEPIEVVENGASIPLKSALGLGPRFAF